MHTNKLSNIACSHECLPPAISLQVQRHLGKNLAAAYRKLDAASSLDYFTNVLARLDASLVIMYQNDERLFRSDLANASRSLYNFAMSLARNTSTADDLVQETMLRAWRSRSGFKAGTNLNAWLFTIMRNNFYTAIRKNAREVADSEGEHAGRLACLPEQTGHVDLHDVQAALSRLTAPMRQALILVAIEDVSYEDAARVMNCEIGTVKSRVWRARQHLALLLGYTGSEVGADLTTLSVMSMPGIMIEM